MAEAPAQEQALAQAESERHIATTIPRLRRGYLGLLDCKNVEVTKGALPGLFDAVLGSAIDLAKVAADTDRTPEEVTGTVEDCKTKITTLVEAYPEVAASLPASKILRSCVIVTGQFKPPPVMDVCRLLV